LNSESQERFLSKTTKLLRRILSRSQQPTSQVRTLYVAPAVVCSPILAGITAPVIVISPEGRVLNLETVREAVKQLRNRSVLPMTRFRYYRYGSDDMSEDHCDCCGQFGCKCSDSFCLHCDKCLSCCQCGKDWGIRRYSGSKFDAPPRKVQKLLPASTDPLDVRLTEDDKILLRGMKIIW
jgi:hypothetical protein